MRHLTRRGYRRTARSAIGWHQIALSFYLDLAAGTALLLSFTVSLPARGQTPSPVNPPTPTVVTTAPTPTAESDAGRATRLQHDVEAIRGLLAARLPQDFETQRLFDVDLLDEDAIAARVRVLQAHIAANQARRAALLGVLTPASTADATQLGGAGDATAAEEAITPVPGLARLDLEIERDVLRLEFLQHPPRERATVNLVTIPNNKFLTDVAACANAGALDMMVQMDFHIGLDQDIGVAKQIVADAITATRYSYLEKPYSVLINEVMLENHLAVRLRAKVYVLDVRYEKALETDVTERVLEGFRDAGVRPPAILHRTVIATPESTHSADAEPGGREVVRQ